MNTIFKDSLNMWMEMHSIDRGKAQYTCITKLAI